MFLKSPLRVIGGTNIVRTVFAAFQNIDAKHRERLDWCEDDAPHDYKSTKVFRNRKEAYALLFGFFMESLLATPRTVLFEFQFTFHFLFIFMGIKISPLTNAAGENGYTFSMF